ncbi:hypothetical protein FQZ97_1150080 [compost metagenome]
MKSTRLSQDRCSLMVSACSVASKSASRTKSHTSAYGLMTLSTRSMGVLYSVTCSWNSLTRMYFCFFLA